MNKYSSRRNIEIKLKKWFFFIFDYFTTARQILLQTTSVFFSLFYVKYCFLLSTKISIYTNNDKKKLPRCFVAWFITKWHLVFGCYKPYKGEKRHSETSLRVLWKKKKNSRWRFAFIIYEYVYRLIDEYFAWIFFHLTSNYVIKRT